MNIKKRKRGIWWGTSVLVGMMCFALFGIRAEAGVSVDGLVSNLNAPFVTWSPDGQAWTVHEPIAKAEKFDPWYEEWKNNQFHGMHSSYTPRKCEFWYWPRDFGQSGPKVVVDTGVPLSIPALGTGQHRYSYNRDGVIPIYRWEVIHETGVCSHMFAADANYHGTTGKRNPCGLAYYSGWHGLCADCGGVLMDVNMYMDIDHVRQLQAIDNRFEFMFRCPNEGCGHIEMGPGVHTHVCSADTNATTQVEE